MDTSKDTSPQPISNEEWAVHAVRTMLVNAMQEIARRFNAAAQERFGR